MRSLRTGLLVVVLLAIAGAAGAITIEPGTYKLEWRVPSSDEQVNFTGRKSTELQRIDKQDDVKVIGLASSSALWGTTDSRAIVLDESKGSGTGYDTAYILAYTPEWTQYDISKGTRIALTGNGPQVTGEAEVDLSLGEPDARITKRARIGLTVFVRNAAPELAILTVRGGWHGKLKTDQGDLDVQLGDMNANGLYSDFLKPTPGESAPGSCDVMILGDPPQKPEDWLRVVYLGSVVFYDNKLYEVQVHPTGETVEIRPYAGEVGHLRIAARDGLNRPADCALVFISGPGMMVMARPGSDLAVLPGKYQCMLAVVRPKDADSAAGIVLVPKDTAIVTRDGLGILKAGGPLKVAIDPGTAYIGAKRGQELQITLVFTAGADQFRGLESGDRNAVANIRDPKGKLLLSGKSSFG